jgi:hypothetical protein
MEHPTVFKPMLGYVRAELIVNCVIVFLVLVIVSLRVLGRYRGPGLWWDDYLVIFAVPLGIAMLACQGLFTPIGNGYSLIEYPELAANIPYILELTFGMQIVYTILLASVKASMLFFFIRVFVTPWMQLASKITLGFVLMWMISYLGACIFLCNPISAQWTAQGDCGEYMPMIQSLIATNAVGDIIIMLLPMRSIWTLHTHKTEKIGITSCFALGLACVVCAVFRLIYISTVDLALNITGTMPTTIFLFILEPNLAILCVSIPMLRPFFAAYKKRVGGSRLKETDESTSGYRDQSRSGGDGTQTSHVRNPSYKPTDPSWEMNNFYPRDKVGKQETKVTTASVNESGSEKSLTGVAHRPNEEIRVETRWAVTHT